MNEDNFQDHSDRRDGAHELDVIFLALLSCMWRVLILAVRWNVLDDARYATMLVEHTRLILHHINPFCTMYSTIPPNTREGSLANNRSHRRRRKNSREKSEEATTLPPPTQFQSRTEFERPKSSSSWSRCRSNIISSFQPIQHLQPTT